MTNSDEDNIKDAIANAKHKLTAYFVELEDLATGRIVHDAERISYIAEMRDEAEGAQFVITTFEISRNDLPTAIKLLDKETENRHGGEYTYHYYTPLYSALATVRRRTGASLPN